MNYEGFDMGSIQEKTVSVMDIFKWGAGIASMIASGVVLAAGTWAYNIDRDLQRATIILEQQSKQNSQLLTHLDKISQIQSSVKLIEATRFSREDAKELKEELEAKLDKKRDK
jgi:hypothetical protein